MGQTHFQTSENVSVPFSVSKLVSPATNSFRFTERMTMTRGRYISP